MAAATATWKTMPYQRPFYSYYEVLDAFPGYSVWISKKVGATQYFVFYSDGKRVASGWRGSQKNARTFAAELIAKYA